MAKAISFGSAGARVVRVASAGGAQQAAPSLTAGSAGSAGGGVRTLLRLEGLAVLMHATAAYAQSGPGWGWFAVLFLLPDLSFLAYLAGSRAGAAAYNAAHSYAGPLLLLTMGMLGALPALLAVALVWCAHIGFDRALGYGLKYASGFGQTHLGRIGRADPW